MRGYASIAGGRKPSTLSSRAYPKPNGGWAGLCVRSRIWSAYSGRGTCLGVALCTLVGTPVFGEPLSWRDALELAERQHPLLRAAEAEIDAAQAGIRTARALPNPVGSFASGRQTIRVPGNVSGTAYGFTAEQVIDWGPVRSTRIALAEWHQARAKALADLTRLEVLSGVRRAFYEVLRLQSEISLLQENVRLVEELLQRVRLRVSVGEGARLEAIRAEAELAVASTAANKAQLELVRALGALRTAIGLPEGAPIQVMGAPEPAATLPDLQALRAEMLDRHPALRLARSEIHAAEARLRHEAAQRIPQPSLLAQVDYPPDTPVYLLGFAVPVPLWNLRQGPIAEAQAQLRRAQEMARHRELELLSALEAAYGRYQIAHQQAQTIEQALLREAQQALEASETAYRLGERGLLEVLDAQRVLRSVRLSFVQAQFERQAAMIDLDALRALDPRQRTN